MSRGTTFLTLLAIATVAWIVAFTATQKDAGSYIHFVVRALPSYLLICLGCYGLFEIGKGIMIVKDYPEEYTSLRDDIARAQNFMKEKKVITN